MCIAGGAVELYNYFSATAKQAIYRASEIAQSYSLPLIEPAHILLAMLDFPEGKAVQLLSRLNLDLSRLASQLDSAIAANKENFKGNPSFSPATLELLNLAHRETIQLGHPSIYTAHLMLILAQSETPPLCLLYAEHRLDAAVLKTEYLAMLLEDGGLAGEDESLASEVSTELEGQPEPHYLKEFFTQPSVPGSKMELYNYFSFSAKKAIYRASEISQNFNNPLVEPEHIFFSILQLRSCSAVNVMNRLNINLPKLTYGLEAHLCERAGTFKGNPQFSARTLQLLDLSFREVKRLGHREIGTPHLLIALAQERHPALRQILDDNRLDPKRIRDAFVEHLKGFAAESKGTVAPPLVPEPGWPAGVKNPIKVGGVTFTPSKTFAAQSLAMLVGSGQLAVVFRQPRITPVELFATLIIDSGRPRFRGSAVLHTLDTLALLSELNAYWQEHCLLLGHGVQEPPLSPALTDLLGRAVSHMLQAAAAAAPAFAVTPEHLLWALLEEPTQPLRGFLDGQLAANGAFAEEVADWLSAMEAETRAAQDAAAALREEETARKAAVMAAIHPGQEAAASADRPEAEEEADAAPTASAEPATDASPLTTEQGVTDPVSTALHEGEPPAEMHSPDEPTSESANPSA